jgi:hypothetical protein
MYLLTLIDAAKTLPYFDFAFRKDRLETLDLL